MKTFYIPYSDWNSFALCFVYRIYEVNKFSNGNGFLMYLLFNLMGNSWSLSDSFFLDRWLLKSAFWTSIIQFRRVPFLKKITKYVSQIQNVTRILWEFSLGRLTFFSVISWSLVIPSWSKVHHRVHSRALSRDLWVAIHHSASACIQISSPNSRSDNISPKLKNWRGDSSLKVMADPLESKSCL